MRIYDASRIKLANEDGIFPHPIKLSPRASRVLNYLYEYGSITPLKALHELGDFRLSASIFELRKIVEIDMNLRKSFNGKRYGEYKLTNPEQSHSENQLSLML